MKGKDIPAISDLKKLHHMMINPTRKQPMKGKKICVMTVVIKQDGKRILKSTFFAA